MGDDNFHLFTSIRHDPALLELSAEHLADMGWHGQPSAFYMLDFHRDRMLRAAMHWGWSAAVETLAGPQGLERMQHFLQGITRQAGNGPHRVKITLARDGALGHEIRPTPPTPLNNLFPAALPEPACEHLDPAKASKTPARDFAFDVLIDNQGTPRSEFTHFKTTRRRMYDEARSRARLGLADKKEVLLVNSDDGTVMEGSISTPYFWRDGRWVTPPVPEVFNVTHGSGGNDGTTRRWALERNLAAEQAVPVASLADGEECWISNGVRGFISARVKLH
ncbi:aminotransferase [Biscogniauxia mediterranea]|nr:aminotransferase [Biscogniauxia mediterranea]